MPYITEQRKEELKHIHPADWSAGDLTYVITDLCTRAVHENLSFERLAVVGSALEFAKLEFYRRVVAPHEDRKIVENGDVY